MSKYFKNFILCGDIDHHCLLCHESFQTVDDLEKHIRWEKHRKNIKDLSPVSKFKKDSIFKIDDKYYCEHCNHVMSTVGAISQHIKESTHQENKLRPVSDLKDTVCRRQDGLIYVDKIKVTNKEWNGLVDGKCIFCDIAVDKLVRHISTTEHMIQMIQTEILISEKQSYRKLNEGNCYCFVCKKTFLMQSMSDHEAEELHIEKIEALNENRDTKADQEKKLEIAIKLINSQRDYFDIDLENKVATCKICTAYVNINFKCMIDHKKLHNITDKDKIEQVSVNMDEVFESLKAKNTPDGKINKKYWFDHGKRRAELAQYGRENFIKLVFPGSKGYCLLCGLYVSAHKKQFTEHINGQKHMGHLELKELDKSGKPHVKPTYKTKKSKDYIRGLINAKQLKVVWVNKRFLVDILSFMLIFVIKGNGSTKIKCYACDIIYDYQKDIKHCLTEKHKQAFLNSEVITTINDEFIREIRPNVYHCGLCNLIFPFWETLDKHLSSWNHSSNKNFKDTTYKICEQIYGGLSSPNLNSDTVYAHIIRLGVI